MVPLLREARVLPYTLVSVATETLSKARRPLELLKVLFFVSKKLGSLVLFFLLLGAEPKLKPTLMSVDHDYSTFSMSKNSKNNKDSEKHNNSDDSSSDIQSTSLVLVQEQSVEPSQNGNHAPPKTRYIYQLTL